jgi:NitT/TauT family transport system substrate-binding protein
MDVRTNSTWSRAALCAFAALGIVVTAGAPAVQAKPLTKVVFSLDFIPLGRHAPWYAALAEGYFKDEGLDVTIIPSQGTAQTVQAVQSGTANLGFVDLPSVALADANGGTLKLVAINYQKAPYAIFSLDPGANVTKPKQLEGLTLGSGSGSSTPKIIRGFMVQHGLNPKTLKVVNVAPPARASTLLARKVPAIEFFVMAKPGLEAAAKTEHARLRTFLMSDWGLQLYSNGIAATDGYLKKNPDVVKRFVAAALKGWRFALDHPDKAAADELRYVPSLKPNIIKAELAVVRGLAVTPDTRKHGLGWFDPAKIQSGLNFVVKYIGIKGTPPKASDLYATGFLPAKPVEP